MSRGYNVNEYDGLESIPEGDGTSTPPLFEGFRSEAPDSPSRSGGRSVGGGASSADSGVFSAPSRPESPQYSKGDLSEDDFYDLERAVGSKNIALFRDVIFRGSFSFDSKIGVEVGIDGEPELDDIYRYLHCRLESFDGGHLTQESKVFLTWCLNAIFESIHRDIYLYVNFETGWVSEAYQDLIRNVISNYEEDTAFYHSVLKAIKGNFDQDFYGKAKDKILENILGVFVDLYTIECSYIQSIFDLFAVKVDGDIEEDFVSLLSLFGDGRESIFDLIIGCHDCESIRSCFSEENLSFFDEILEDRISSSPRSALEVLSQIAQNDWRLLQDLIKSKGEGVIFSISHEGKDLMRHALEDGNHALVGALIDNGWDVSKKYLDQKGRNILHLAAESGNNHIVEMVFDSDVVLQKDDDGANPLYYALMNNHFESFWEILNACKTRGVGDSDENFLPIFYIVDFVKHYKFSDQRNRECLLKLLKAGFDFDARNQDGKVLTEVLIDFFFENIESVHQNGEESDLKRLIFLTLIKCSNDIKFELVEKFKDRLGINDFLTNLSDTISFVLYEESIALARDEFDNLVGFVMKLRDGLVHAVGGVLALEQATDGASRLTDLKSASSSSVFASKFREGVYQVIFCNNILRYLLRNSVFLMNLGECEGIFDLLEGESIRDLSFPEIIAKVEKGVGSDSIMGIIDECIEVPEGDGLYNDSRWILYNFYNCLSERNDLKFATSVITKLSQNGIMPDYDITGKLCDQDGSQFKKVLGILSKSYDRAGSVFYGYREGDILVTALEIYDGLPKDMASRVLLQLGESELIDQIKQKRADDFDRSPKRRRVAVVDGPPPAIPISSEAAAALDRLAGRGAEGSSR